jgi:hypothetical protein
MKKKFFCKTHQSILTKILFLRNNRLNLKLEYIKPHFFRMKLLTDLKHFCVNMFIANILENGKKRVN